MPNVRNYSESNSSFGPESGNRSRHAPSSLGKLRSLAASASGPLINVPAVADVVAIDAAFFRFEIVDPFPDFFDFRSRQLWNRCFDFLNRTHADNVAEMQLVEKPPNSSRTSPYGCAMTRSSANRRRCK